MTRILVQRGSSGGSSSNPNQTRSGGSLSARAEPQVTVPLPARDEESGEEVIISEEVWESGDFNKGKSDELLMGSIHLEQSDGSCDDEGAVVAEKDVREEVLVKGLSGLRISERVASEKEGTSGGSSSSVTPGSGSSCPPPPPVPPPKPSTGNLSSRRNVLGASNSGSVGSSRRAAAWPVVSARTSPAGSRPSSPRSHNENEGYNSADEQKPCFVSSYDDLVVS